MNLVRRRLTILLVSLCLILTSAIWTSAQQRKPQSRPQPKAAATPAPNVSFDSLISTESYNLYGEVRGVGQVVRANTINQLLDPVLKFAGPPKEFKSLVKWLNTNADEVMTSRMFVAAWRAAPQVPDVLVAIEFPSAEEAAKFEPKLNAFLPKLLPPVADPPAESSGEPEKAKATAAEKAPVATKPSFYLKQLGSLVLITSAPLDLKKLRPAGSKLLSDDPQFKIARNRFASEPIFLFIDMKGIEKEEQERRKAYAEMAKKEEEEVKKAEAAAEKEEAEAVPVEADKPDEIVIAQPIVVASTPQTQTPNELAGALSLLGSAFSGGPAKWPEAIGLALAFENESIDIRSLFLSAPGERSDPIPFLPILSPGPSLVPESPSILPADTELFVIASLDLPQLHASLSKAPPPGTYRESRGNVQTVKEIIPESPVAALERQLKINFKDELLPLLGPEIVLTMPASEMGFVPGVGGDVTTSVAAETTAAGSADNFTLTETVQTVKLQPVVALSLRDKEGMKRLMPKIIESIGFKGAEALAQVERRDDTELVSYAKVFAYAYIGNFIVLSPDAGSVRHWVDAYLKHETLSSDAVFKDSIRWQPRQLQSLGYVSPALMKSYKASGGGRGMALNQQAKLLFEQLGFNPQPITYSLSNEGLGAFHELHVPKDLILMLLTGISSEINPPEEVTNEREAMGVLYSLVYAQKTFKEKKGQGYGSLDQLVAENEWLEASTKSGKYRYEMIASGDTFEITAVPIEYGKSGKMSYFVDQTGVIRGADHAGGPATAADKPVSMF